MWRRREEEERWRLRGPLLFLLLLFCSWLAVAGDADTCHNILVDLCVGLYETSGLVVRRSHYVFFFPPSCCGTVRFMRGFHKSNVPFKDVDQSEISVCRAWGLWSGGTLSLQGGVSTNQKYRKNR